MNADGAGSPMPAAVRAQVQELGPSFIEYMDLQSRMRADMSRISVREKAFTSMAVDVVYQTLQESFRATSAARWGAGATHDEVRAAVRATAPSGMARTRRALTYLKSCWLDSRGSWLGWG